MGVEEARRFPYRGGLLAGMAMFVFSVSVPVTGSPAVPTLPRRLAIVVPVTVSFSADAVSTVVIICHVQTVVPGVMRIQPRV